MHGQPIIKKDIMWPTATFGYNMPPHTQNKFCPLELLFGRERSIPGLLQSRSHYPDYWGEMTL
jgi:hypothetical protein